MGEAKQRTQQQTKCIYCGSQDNLTNEHIIPYGLSGDLVLKNGSCSSCAEITSKLEGRLLRGHWLAYRQLLRLKTRRPNKQPKDVEIKVKQNTGHEFSAIIPIEQYPIVMIVEFDPPSILKGIYKTGLPYASRMGMKYITNPPISVTVEDSNYKLLPTDNIEYPVHFDAIDFCRFLAKIAHGYAISKRGINCCSEFFLPKIILGDGQDALTYIGGASSPFLSSKLNGNKLHALIDRINGPYLSVYIQLFRDKGDPPPIYEVIVGKAHL